MGGLRGGWVRVLRGGGVEGGWVRVLRGGGVEVDG